VAVASFGSNPVTYAILTDECMLENGLLTPTQKVRRKAIAERYRAQLAQLYDAIRRARAMGNSPAVLPGSKVDPLSPLCNANVADSRGQCG
jgi:hypothetical protein